MNHVEDNTGYTSNYTEDIDNQSSNNYTYDAIGNLISDDAEGINLIEWTVYGKISHIQKESDHIYYTYDAAGNRISKVANGKTTIYVRDASGNVMSIYEAAGEGDPVKTEDHLYGSSRIGIANKLTVAPADIPFSEDSDLGMTISTFTRGEKNYELSNHLGNVLVTITDKKIRYSASIDDYYGADVVSAVDYFPFGMTMPGRSYSSDGYRYGFNGKEKDADISSSDYDFGARVYDGRVARWLSTDPMSEKYPSFSPYNFVVNNPILFKDANGKDFILGFWVTEDMWQTFKSIIEKRFKGLVTLSRSEMEYSTKYWALPTDKKSWEEQDKFWKVDWTINEQKLTETAKAELPSNASPDEITKKKNEIQANLTSGFSYKALDKIMNGNVHAAYDLYGEEREAFGSAAELGSRSVSLQGINVRTPFSFEGQDVLTPFCMLFHEIMEGYYITSIRYNPSANLASEFSAKDYLEYAYGHWLALIDQATEAKVDFMYSTSGMMAQSGKNKLGITVTFTKIKSGPDKNKYLRNEYYITMVDGKVTDVSKSTLSTVVSDAEYKREKNEAKQHLKNGKKRR